MNTLVDLQTKESMYSTWYNQYIKDASKNAAAMWKSMVETTQTELTAIEEDVKDSAMTVEKAKEKYGDSIDKLMETEIDFLSMMSQKMDITKKELELYSYCLEQATDWAKDNS